jgi:rhamnogalacturonan endolyase
MAALGALLLLAGCGGASDPAVPADQPTRLLASTAAAAGFGVTDSGGYLIVNSGAGLIFKVRRNGGDITSIRYQGGPELQSQRKFSHIASGIGATTSYTVSGGVIKVTLNTSSLTHYLLVRQGENNIYMATHITAEPTVGELRWITRLNGAVLTRVPLESKLIGNVGAIESADVFGLPNEHSRSKYYGNQRAIDLGMRGVGGDGVGVYMAYGNRESSSGGPFFRDIQNQSGTDTELYNYMNSGHAQTEENRLGLHGPYALLFTSGTAPAAVPDMRWIGAHGLTGWVGPQGRGKVVGVGLAGRDPGALYTVAFANDTAQYWTRPAANGSFGAYHMKAGTYRMTVYKGELEVYTESVTVPAGGAAALNTRTIGDDPASAPALWRIGNWDGAPFEFRNGQTFIVRHPSDPRNAPWGPVTHAVGSATNTFPAAQWKTGVNNPVKVTFQLRADQIVNRTVRIGITTAFAGGRPAIQVNNWSSPLPKPSVQPDSRGMTIGTYRGNNARFSYSVPASALVVGLNTMTINVVSGSSGERFLSPGFAYDALDML